LKVKPSHISETDRAFIETAGRGLREAEGSPDPLFQRDDDISEIRRIQAAYHKTDRNAQNNFFAGQVDAVFPSERGRKSEDTYAGEFDEDTDIDDENDIIIEYYRAKELAQNFRDTGEWGAETAEDKRLVEWIKPAYEAGVLSFDEIADVGSTDFDPDALEAEGVKETKPEADGRLTTSWTKAEAAA
jgi:hypothetical protein